MSTHYVPVRRALLSVSDKTGLIELTQVLCDLNVELLSTGGTAAALRTAGLPVRDVSEVTGFPEMMDGRVKTLHPLIHGGLLGRAEVDEAVMAQHGITAIDLLVLNLYPFERVTARADCTLAEAVENIDIGGPAMLRSAAKNYARVAVVTDPAQYSELIIELKNQHGSLSSATRFNLSVNAFNRVAQYDAAISNYLSSITTTDHAIPQRSEFPQQLNTNFIKLAELRYGENPHQSAALYRDINPPEGSLANFEQLQGKELSYNNLADTDAALACVRQFEHAACVIVKHANPCGVAVAENLLTAYEKAYATDPTSAFGGIIAFNQVVDEKTIHTIIQRQFVEVIIAPDYSQVALQLVQQKPNIRVLRVGALQTGDDYDLKRIDGGLLVQKVDNYMLSLPDLKTVSKRQPSDQELNDLIFAWRVAKYVKSNAIVYAHNQRTIGVGAGQMSRVYSARIAAIKAADVHLQVSGAVMASDAFFPFRDGIDAAAQAGIAAVIQPGGSLRDEEVIAAANEYGMAMVFTGIRHFRH